MLRRTTTIGAALLTVLCHSAAGPEFLAREKRVTVQGRVTGASGEPFPGWPVTLISTQRYVELNKFRSGGDVVTVARTTTDANGYFTFDVPHRSGHQFWFLRFMDSAAFDAVRYLAPRDVEITAEARRGRVAEVEQIIRHHPQWAEVERRVSEAGGGSTPKGRILLALGLPEKDATNPDSGEQEWWYFTRGIVYTFRGDEPTGSRRFEAVRPPDGEARPVDGEGR